MLGKEKSNAEKAIKSKGKIQIDDLDIHVGQEFKSYPAMCKFLGLEVKTGKARQLQLESIRCYFEFHKVDNGNKIIVDEVFNKSKTKVDKRNVFAKTIEKAVIEELFHHARANEDEPMIISKGGLMRKIELFNRNCYEARCNISAFAKRYKLDEKQVEDILSLNHRSGSDNLKKAIESLKKQRLITVDETLGLNFGKVKHYNSVDMELSKGDVQEAEVVEKTLIQYATQKQRDWIQLVAERSILDEFGLRTIDDVYGRGFKFAYGTFYPKVMKYIKEHCCNKGNSSEIRALVNLEHYYKVLVINFEPSFIIREHERLGSLTQDDKSLIQELMKSEELEQYLELGGACTKHEVSILNQKRYLINAKTRHNKAIKNGSTQDNRHEASYLETAKRINDICYNHATKEYFTVGNKSSYQVKKEKIVTR